MDEVMNPAGDVGVAGGDGGFVLYGGQVIALQRTLDHLIGVAGLVGPEEPGDAGDEGVRAGFKHGEFAITLGPAVDVHRFRRVVFGPGIVRSAAEDVVGAEVDHAGAAAVAVLGQRLRAGHVGELRFFRLDLAGVWAGEAGCIEEDVE